MAEINQISALVFGPQSETMSLAALKNLRSFLLQHKKLSSILEALAELDNVRLDIAKDHEDVSALRDAISHTQSLVEWAKDESCEDLGQLTSGFIIIPILTILEICQYLNFIWTNNLTHEEFGNQINARNGSLQGFCGGLACAMVIGSSRTEEEIIERTAIAVRLTYIIGLFSEIDQDAVDERCNIVVIRVKTPGQGEELIKQHSKAYISATNDPRTISVTGSRNVLDSICRDARNLKYSVQELPLRGKWHNPENQHVAEKLIRWCGQKKAFQLPNAEDQWIPVRSNMNGLNLTNGPLTKELIFALLTAGCQWDVIVNETANDLKSSGYTTHTIAIFGAGDVTPNTPFIKRRLKISKIDASRLFDESTRSRISNYIYPEDSIAIIGASCRIPGANDMHELWQLVATGADLHRELDQSRFDIFNNWRAPPMKSGSGRTKYYANLIDDIQRFDHKFFGISGREAANIDPQQRMILEVAYEAMESCGYAKRWERLANDPIGCFIGASFVEYLENTCAHNPTAYTSPGTIRAFISGRISHFFGWSGPSEVIDTACSSSLVAINRACKAIQNNECATALAGGINLITGMTNFLDLSRAGFLSPTGQCKPFDASADGYCRSDGAGLVVLKSLKQAQADGDEILGVIPGVHTTQAGLSSYITLPHSPAQTSLYREVLRQASMKSDLVTYVESHGTGTRAGDPIEMESIRQVFGGQSRSQKLHVGSIKGHVGHTETAAGVTGLLKVIAMLTHGAIPPQASFKSLNPKIPPLGPENLEINQTLRPWDADFRTAMVNSYGAAGSTAALLCCEPPPLRSRNHQSYSEEPTFSFPIILSATTRAGILKYAHVLLTYLKRTEPKPKIGDVAFTLERKLRHFANCVALRVSSTGDLIDSLENNEFAEHSLPPSIKPVVLVFGGQGKFLDPLDESLCRKFPTFSSHLADCSRVLERLGFSPIMPKIFQSQGNENIGLLQCSQVSIQYACAKTWIDAGLKVEAIIGHSLGELIALAVAGVLSLEDCFKLIATRARLIETEWGPEHGTMLAVQSPDNNVQSLIDEFLPQTKQKAADESLEIACHNSSSGKVVVGSSEMIAEFEQHLVSELDLRDMKLKRLDTTHGFHSSLAEPILSELTKVSTTLTWKQPLIPLETCTQKPLDNFIHYSPSDHARKPVSFEDAIKRIEQRLGPCVWLDAGICTPGVQLIEKTADKSLAHEYVKMMTTSKVGVGDLVSETTLKLWLEGIDVSYWGSLKTNATSIARQIWLPPYQFDTSHHWLENIDRAIENPTVATKSEPKLTQNKISVVPSDLVLKKELSQTCTTAGQFNISTTSDTYRTIVAGHLIRGRPLCPAPMYMECVTLGLRLTGVDIQSECVQFQNLMFLSPLGLASDREVVLKFSETETHRKWQFKVESYSKSENGNKAAQHATGLVALSTETNFDVFGRIFSAKIETLKRSSEPEKLFGSRAYKMFSTVVDYASCLRGISQIRLCGEQAYAEIRRPENLLEGGALDSHHICDAILMDNFIQVVGLLMNSSDFVEDDHVVIMTGVDDCKFLPSIWNKLAETWNVYATFLPTSDNQTFGDLFVFNSSGQTVAVLSGCRFQKLAKRRLERSLEAENDQGRRAPEIKEAAVSTPSLMKASALTENKDEVKVRGENTATVNIKALRNTVAEYAGLETAQINDEATLEDLGIDSLAATELAGDLSERYGVDFEVEELQTCNIKTISNQIKSSSTYSSTPSDRTSDELTLSTSVSKITTPSEHSVNHDEIPKSGKKEASSSHAKELLFKAMSDVSGVAKESIKDSMTLEELGIDSLAVMDLKYEIEQLFGVEIDDEKVDISHCAKDLASLIGDQSVSEVESQTQAPQDGNIPSVGHTNEKGVGTPQASELIRSTSNTPVTDPLSCLMGLNAKLDEGVRGSSLNGYAFKVMLLLDRMVLCYVVQAFQDASIDLSNLRSGQVVPDIPHIKKYDSLVERLWLILEKHGIITRSKDGYLRSNAPISKERPTDVGKTVVNQFPDYESEVRLIELTGSDIAGCLNGSINPLSRMFGTAKNLSIVQDFYASSPLLKNMNYHLMQYLFDWITRSKSIEERPLEILEVGAGSGATTAKIIEALKASSVPVRYTFTDTAKNLLQKARSKFADLSWIDFQKYDLEEEPPAAFKSRFDIIIGTNCVHATTDRASTIRRLRQTLRESGFIVLSEVTDIIDWYDITFGLLDGWWLGEGGHAYPLQSAKTWMSYFQKAGFYHTGYSQGQLQDSNIQRLLIACMQGKGGQCSQPNLEQTSDTSLAPEVKKPNILTFSYKQVDGTSLEADVYIPSNKPSQSIAVAMLLHGGGYVTLSKGAVRPQQVSHLLNCDILPVSISYRLCPNTSIIEGAMCDAADAYLWVQNCLPQLLRDSTGLSIAVDSIVVIGWSTGGHLAMTLDWTLKRRNINQMPKAILSFYAPVDFDPQEIDCPRSATIPRRSMPMGAIIKSLHEEGSIVCSHRPSSGNPNDTRTKESMTISELGCFRARNDPRSELLLSMFSEGTGLPILLNGLPKTSAHLTEKEILDTWLLPPTSALVDEISPMAHAKSAQYSTPTFLVQGLADEVAPPAAAKRFIDILHDQRIDVHLLELPGVSHLFDIELAPGSEFWDNRVAPGYDFIATKLAE